MGVWLFLVSFELLGGRVEKGNYFLLFNYKFGGKRILMVE